MKYTNIIIVVFMLLFTKASAQSSSNGYPWDKIYKIPKEQTLTVNGEKGKVIVIKAIKSALEEGAIGRIGKVTFSKKDSRTGEKVELQLISAVSDGNYLLREDEELNIETKSTVVVYLSGYIYDAH